MISLTDEQVAEISSAKPGPELTEAVRRICCSASMAFPILRIIDQQLAVGRRIEMRDGKTCLIDAKGEIVSMGDGLQELLVSAVMTLC